MLSTAVLAQVQFGVKTGANFSFLSEKTVQTGAETDTLKRSDIMAGFLVGAYANYAFTDMWGAQMEVLYSMQGGKWENGKVIQHYVNIPILLNVKPIANNPFSIVVGPQLGIAMARKNTAYTNENIVPNKGYTKPDERFDFSAVLGVQYTFIEHLSVGLRYNFGLTPSMNMKLMNTKIKGERNNVLQLSVGWTF